VFTFGQGSHGKLFCSRVPQYDKNIWQYRIGLGQLGLGDYYPKRIPQLVDTQYGKQRVAQLSCGGKHTWALQGNENSPLFAQWDANPSQHEILESGYCNVWYVNMISYVLFDNIFNLYQGNVTLFDHKTSKTCPWDDLQTSFLRTAQRSSFAGDWRGFDI